MSKEELIEFLRENLSISVLYHTAYGGGTDIIVELLLQNVMISSDSGHIPHD